MERITRVKLYDDDEDEDDEEFEIPEEHFGPAGAPADREMITEPPIPGIREMPLG